MIHVAIGTKAQFIKMAPVLRALEERSIPFHLVDLGQHALITRNLRREFAVRAPDRVLSAGGNVVRLAQGLRWVVGLARRGLDRHRLREEVFGGRPGICLVHGDTASTLLAVLLAKRAGLRVAHIEAGLRSYHLGEPFPEEMVRLAAMRFSDILFAPSPWARENLVRMGLGSRCVLLAANTSVESLAFSLNQPAGSDVPPGPYALVTVHRMENIFSRRRLGLVRDLVERIARMMTVVFVQHQPTLLQLKKFGLQASFERLADIRLLRILSHSAFLHHLARAEFVVTDGGSIQEESACLGVPCLLLRKHTERMDGIGLNVMVGGTDCRVAMRFLENYPRLRVPPAPPPKVLPSKQIIDHLIGLAAARA
jgi:UDP-N-acetylglucosamine 2-epimerase